MTAARLSSAPSKARNDHLYHSRVFGGFWRDAPVKSFNNMTEIVLVGSFKNMTKRPSVFSVLVICKSPPGSRPSGGSRPMRRTGSEVIGGPLEITLERAFFSHHFGEVRSEALDLNAKTAGP